ncbi:CHAP domain-containing protein [Kitasatospora acidiphila]|uniref:CHAP domain-containing protein n=1 Tax=Kitasatospora acidiphila TaxID=2567942 RepID=UPI003C747586
MSRRPIRRFAAVAAAALAFGLPMVAGIPSASADSLGAGQLAAANVGNSAGTCADNSMTNSLGGSEYESSCDGNNGSAEYWCADFVKWAWENSGLNVDGLTAAAGSFAQYGQNNGTLNTSADYTPQVGDAIIYGWDGNAYADHVGIVTAVNPDGSIVTANGDLNGTGSDEVSFSQSSSVISVTIPADQVASGNVTPQVGYTISGYVTPVAAS